MRLSLCLLTWNEVAGCRIAVPGLPRAQFEEVFAVDGGSTDGTVDYLESQGIPVIRQERPGYNAAYACAFRRCATDALVIYHPKGTIDPAEVLKFRPLFEQGYDLVVASRLAAGAANEEDGRLLKPRKWFVIALGLIASLLWRRRGATVWDVLHGFRGMRPAAFFALPPLESGLSIDLEMVVRAYRKRLSAIEFPVSEARRPSGTTHFKAFSTGRQLLKYLVFELVRGA
jgi:glycosyltransferase involved in cell wall biosynthesis